MLELNGLNLCIGKGIPLQHQPDDVIFWYPEVMKTPEEIFFFMKKVEAALKRSEEQGVLEPATYQEVYVYTMSPQIVGMVGGRDEDIEYEDVVVLCPKHPPQPLVDPSEKDQEYAPLPPGVFLRDYMAHFNLADLYMSHELKCPACIAEKENGETEK
jgi:hypothetical protein